MVARWVGFIAFIAIIMAIVGASAQGSTLALDPAGDSTLDPNIKYIMSYTEAWQENDWGTLVSPVANVRMFSAMFGLLIGQQNLYAIFPAQTPWIWVWMIIWIPIVVTVIFGILMLFFAILQRIIS